MDWLLERPGRIERRLAERHLKDGALVLYDVTSTWLEGRCCPLAHHGYSRDGKRGKTHSTLEQQYRRNGKWLAFFGAGAFDVIDVAIYVDLADYMGLTAEGRGEGGNSGDSWVTVWVDGGIGAQVSLLPVSFGVAKLSFEAAEPDPRRRYRVSVGTGTLPGFSIVAVERGEGDDGPEWGNISMGALGASAGLFNFTANLMRFEIKRTVLDAIIEEAFGSTVGVAGPTALSQAASRLAKAMVVRDPMTGGLRIVASGVRKFTSSDDGPVADRKYIDGTIMQVYGGQDVNGDGLGDVTYSYIPSLLKAGYDTFVKFENIGNNTSDFFVKAEDVPAGWSIWARDGGNRLGDQKFDIKNLRPGEAGLTKWTVSASAIAAPSARIRFRLYHDGILPVASPWLGNEFLDEVKVTLHRRDKQWGSALGDTH